MPVISTFGRLRQKDGCEFKAGVLYIINTGQQRNTVSLCPKQNKMKENKTKAFLLTSQRMLTGLQHREKGSLPSSGECSPAHQHWPGELHLWPYSALKKGSQDLWLPIKEAEAQKVYWNWPKATQQVRAQPGHWHELLPQACLALAICMQPEEGIFWELGL